MISYVFDNKQASHRIISKITNVFDFNIRQVSTEDYLLSNADMMINIGKKRTNIILYNSGCNISTIRKFFMEK